MKNIGININSIKDKDGTILNKIISNIKECIPDANVVVFKDCINLNWQNANKLEVIIVLGGDGTILGTARTLAHNNLQIPMLGINIGHLGFLTGAEIGEFNQVINRLHSNNYHVEDRMMIKCIMQGKVNKFVYNALNDIVISKGTLARIVKYDVNIDEKFYTSFTSDGIIVSTPTGSTAYSLSAGGPLIYPTLNLISITPICPHSLESRTMIIDKNSKVTINVKRGNESVFLTVDGQISVQLRDIEKIDVCVSSYKCKLIKFDYNNYFEILRDKLSSRTNICEGDK